MKKIYDIPKEYLEEHSIHQQKSADKICNELNIKSKTVIFRLLKKYKIKSNSREGRPHKKTKKFGEIHQSYICILKERSNRKNLTFNLNGNYLWKLFLKQNRCCSLSGIEIVFPKAWGIRSKTQITASLDRIDSNKGYIKGNIQVISIICNHAKNNLTHNEMLEFCKIMSKV